MNIRYTELENGDSSVCELVLRALPNWFGIEASTDAYIDKSAELPMIVAYNDHTPVAFLSLKQHSDFSFEIYIMGVLPEFHGNGIGKDLVGEAEKYIVNRNAEFLQVKTVDASRECEFYKKTRLFYKALGFKELEVFPTLWDEFNPCLLMIKNVKS